MQLDEVPTIRKIVEDNGLEFNAKEGEAHGIVSVQPIPTTRVMVDLLVAINSNKPKDYFLNSMVQTQDGIVMTFIHLSY